MSEAQDEFGRLVRDFRSTLQELARGGCQAVPAGQSPGAVVSSSQEAPEVAKLAHQPAVEPAPVEAADAAVAEPAPVEVAPVEAAPVEVAVAEPVPSTLAGIREALGDCQRCGLASQRTKLVFGVGSASASLMFVGEAPGADEDRIGEPFVGPAGQLLDKMIVAMGWTRDSVYIANVLKCRPPNNRDPSAEEVAACRAVLASQIDAIAPQVIVTLGKPAAHLLLDSSAPISALRGNWHEHRGIALMPTFHPAYLLRNAAKKREAWSDLQQVMQRLASSS